MASSVTAGNSTESAGQHYSTATTLRLYDDNNCLSVCYTRSVPAGGRFDRERETDRTRRLDENRPVARRRVHTPMLLRRVVRSAVAARPRVARRRSRRRRRFIDY